MIFFNFGYILFYFFVSVEIIKPCSHWASKATPVPLCWVPNWSLGAYIQEYFAWEWMPFHIFFQTELSSKPTFYGKLSYNLFVLMQIWMGRGNFTSLFKSCECTILWYILTSHQRHTCQMWSYWLALVPGYWTKFRWGSFQSGFLVITQNQ